LLLAEHRAHVELLPTGRHGYYRLTPTGHVGTIVCPTCRLLIRPKIPLENLFYLLDPAAPVRIVEDQITPVPAAAGLLALFVASFALVGAGYAGVEGFTRGKACSPDKPIPYEHDGADAAAVIDWISRQPWSDGRVGMYGGSYEGFTQWAAAKHRPKALKAMMPSVTAAPGIALLTVPTTTSPTSLTELRLGRAY